MLGFFFNQVAEIDSVSMPQDDSGGEVLVPRTAAVLVPCCVQQDTRPERSEDGIWRRGTSGRLRVFFRPGDSSSAAAVAGLAVKDRITITGGSLAPPYPVAVDGPAFDAAGRGEVWEVACRDIR